MGISDKDEVRIRELFMELWGGDLTESVVYKILLYIILINLLYYFRMYKFQKLNVNN
jgi:hypothetical protein